MSSPFQKLFSRKKAELIKPETGMLVPRDGTKLQKAIHSDHDNLSNKEIREANREYKKSVRKYNRKNDTNLAKKPPKKDTSLAPKMEQERKSLNPGAIKSVMENQNVSEKEAIAIVNKRRSESRSNAKLKEESKNGWSTEKCKSKRAELKEVLAKDPYAEFGDILKQQIAENC